MSRFIRWQGLIAFAAILALLSSFVYLFAEPIVRKGLESSVAQYTGAEVNIESVELNYFPLNLTVNGLQVTDAGKPEQNLLAFDSASAGIDLWQYFYGKTIIEQLAVNQLKFDQVRVNVGEVYRQPKQQEENTQEQGALPEVNIALPDPKTLLDDSNLITVKRAKTLEASYQEEKQKLADLKENLPSKDKLKYYQDEVKKLTKVKVKSLDDLDKLQKQFDALKKEFKADQKLVKQAKEQLSDSQKLLSTQLTDLKNAPEEDWQVIAKQYQLDQIGGDDFAHILFGEQARAYYQYTDIAWQYMLAKSSGNQEEVAALSDKGRFVHFDAQDKLPSFLIKQANISVSLPQGDFEITIKELTHQHWIRQLPTMITSQTNELAQGGSIGINGQFALNEQQQVSAKGDWQVNAMPIANKPLSDSKELQLTLEKSHLTAKGQLVVDNNQLHSNNHFTLADSQLAGNASKSSYQFLLNTLKKINKLEIELDAEGAIDSPDISLSSSLDDVLKEALGQQVNAKVEQFKESMQTGLNQKLADSLDISESQAEELAQLSAVLNDTEGALKSLEDSDVIKAKKKKLKNKAKDKLKDKLGDIFG